MFVFQFGSGRDGSGVQKERTGDQKVLFGMPMLPVLVIVFELHCCIRLNVMVFLAEPSQACAKSRGCPKK